MSVCLSVCLKVPIPHIRKVCLREVFLVKTQPESDAQLPDLIFLNKTFYSTEILLFVADSLPLLDVAH